VFLWLFLQISLAAAPTCELITAGNIRDIQPPAVIVLGERHATQPDLRRANRIVNHLQTVAPVTLALEAVQHNKQVVLDNFAANKLSETDLPELLDWQNSWGFPYKPYAPLVSAAQNAVTVIGAGLELGMRPVNRTTPIPNGYINILRDAMGEHDMPVEMEGRFVQSMAWRDFSIANNAVQKWDQKGYLVILVGRGHVEGGKGVQWQAQRMVGVPVHSFVLAWANPPCYAGDKVWKPSLFETLFRTD
jgi:uncharacterized iron-regulated protein